MSALSDKVESVLEEAVCAAQPQRDTGQAHQIIMRSIRFLTELAEQIAADETATIAASPVKIYQRRPRPGYALGAMDGEIAARLYKERRARDLIFQQRLPSVSLFGEPAWDILLDLLHAEVTRKRVSVTSACLASSVPATTALRWLSHLADLGLVSRVDDETDKRRAFLRLTSLGSQIMQTYFDKIAQLR